MKKNILFLDIDGTLYDNDNGHIPTSAIEAIKEISSHTEIVIATGRAKYMLHSIEEIIDLVEYFVLINGQYITRGDEVLYSNPLPYSLLTDLVKALDELEVAYGFQGGKEEAISHIDEFVIESFETLGLNLPQINKEFYVNNEVYQMWCFGTDDDLETIRRNFPNLQFIPWLNVGFDILLPNTSKGGGMLKLLEKLELPHNNVYAIGDGDNDYEMILNAPVGIAMGNATKRVKSVADYITDNVENDGLYKALKYYNLL